MNPGLHFYRQPGEVAAIGFDLDDTLYDNGPLLQQAEAALLAYLAEHFPASRGWDHQHWLTLRQQLAANDPGLAEDITAARHQCLRLGLRQAGYAADRADAGAEAAMAVFLHWRNRITLPASLHVLLTRLAAQRPLFVISNGNADITALGLAQYFQFALHAGPQWPMKPARAMFDHAQQRLALPAAQILYVGDHPRADVLGATRAGWQSAWVNPGQQPLVHRHNPLQLPTCELRDIYALRHWLG